MAFLVVSGAGSHLWQSVRYYSSSFKCSYLSIAFVGRVGDTVGADVDHKQREQLRAEL